MNYEEGRANLGSLISSQLGQLLLRNEATTRLQLIDSLFFDCLAWEKSNAYLEEPQGSEYADYTFSFGGKKLLIVEAKKEGDLFELPAGNNRIIRPLGPLLRDSKSLRAAVEQAAGYCQKRGVALAAVTDGHQIVAFVGARTDGVPPLSANALVLSSLEVARDNFLDLWQSLSRPGVEQRHLWAKLSGSHIQELPPKLSASIQGYPGLISRNPFQADLQILSEYVLEDIVKSEDLEPVFLQECYAQSGALSQYSLLSRDILQARYTALFPEEDRLPTSAPVLVPATTTKGISSELVADSLSRRPILLLGDVGVGKTTFARRLIRVDAAEQFSNSITLSVNFGSMATLTDDLRSFVLDEIERQLRDDHRIDIRENNFIRGVYRSDVQRFKKSLYGPLAETDPAAFARLEIEELHARVSKQDQHLRLSIEHLQKARRQQVVLFLDNADQRNYETQQGVFLIAQEIAENWPVTVFVALRPETFHRSVRSGALSGYHAKAFTISPPRTDLLIARRLNFAIRLLQGDFPLPDIAGRTTVNSESLRTLMEIFLGSIKNNRSIVEFIDNTCAGNMRIALNMVKTFFGSGHVDTDKMIQIYEGRGTYSIPLHEFVRAVIYGDNVHYDPSRSLVANLFDVSRPDAREHFVLPLLLSSVQALAGTETHMGYIPITSVYEYLQGLGYQPDQIEHAIQRGVAVRLIEQSPGRFTEFEASEVTALRITSIGAYHLKRLVRLFAYQDAVIVDTPILNRSIREAIGNVNTIEERLERVQHFRNYLDLSWQQLESTGDTFDWPNVSTEIDKEIEEIRRRVEVRKERERNESERGGQREHHQ